MNEEDAGFAAPDPPQEETADMPFLEEARKIEKDMYQVMTTQVRLAIIQIVLAGLSILAALVIATKH